MFCPYCGKENPDGAKFCAGCGSNIEEEPVYSAPQEEQQPSDGSVTKWRRILIIIIIIAAAVIVAVLVISRVPSVYSPEEDAAQSASAREGNNEAVLSEDDAEEAETPDEAEGFVVSEEAAESDAAQEIEDTEAEEQAIAGTESTVLTGAKESAEYTIRTQTSDAKDKSGTVILEADYDLVVLEGEDDVNQKINSGLEQDCQSFLAYTDEDEAEIESYSAEGMRYSYEAEADVAYDKNGVLSILYNVEYDNPSTTHTSAYGLTYSLETGDRAGIRDLTDMTDDELLEEFRTALRQADMASAYFDNAEGKINALTVDEIGDEFSFIVEGGEIVIVVPSGTLAPESAGSFKVPTTVYINNMNYDEYTNDYIFSDSSSRRLTRDDLTGLSKEELRLARNEIFARHGRLFRDEALNRYFSSKSWYNGTAYEEDFDEGVFSSLEWDNLDLLNAYDKEMGYQ